MEIVSWSFELYSFLRPWEITQCMSSSRQSGTARAHATFCKSAHTAQCSYSHCRLLASPWIWCDLWVIIICIWNVFLNTNTLKVFPSFHSLYSYLVTFEPKNVLEEFISEDRRDHFFFLVICCINIYWSVKPMWIELKVNFCDVTTGFYFFFKLPHFETPWNISCEGEGKHLYSWQCPRGDEASL